MSEILYPGDPKHPEHNLYLVELGKATYAAAGVAGICFNIIRVHNGVDSSDLYNDPLGGLQQRLKKETPDLDGIVDFMELLERAHIMRNDLLHALPVKHGLHRRRTDDLYYAVEFFTIDSLTVAERLFSETRGLGNRVFYSDGGKAVDAWYEKGKRSNK